MGDIAIDDIRFSHGCLQDHLFSFPRVPACHEDEYTCHSDGNCRSIDTRCNFVVDCKDGSDEVGCPGQWSVESHSLMIVLVIIVLALSIGGSVAAYVINNRRRRRKNNDVFRVTYDTGLEEIEGHT